MNKQQDVELRRMITQESLDKFKDIPPGETFVPQRYLKNKTEARMFLYFEAQEVFRHLQDIENICRDMADIEREWGVKRPVVKAAPWILTKRPR